MTTDQAMTMNKLLIMLALVLLPGLAQAQIMKCVGAGGRVEFAAACPPGTKAENTGIRSTPSPATAPAASQKSLAERDAEFRKRQVEQQDTAKKTEDKNREAADMSQNCESSKGYLTSLKAGMSIGKTDPKTGERSYLGDSDRAVEIERAQRAVDSNCK
jgi:hypothetical protein